MHFILRVFISTIACLPLTAFAQQSPPQQPVPPLTKSQLDESLKDFGTKVLNYFSTDKKITNRGNAMMIFQESPGGDNNQATLAINAKNANFGKFDQVDPTLVDIINDVLYGTEEGNYDEQYANFFNRHAQYCSWLSPYEVDNLNCKNQSEDQDKKYYQHADIKASILMNEVELSDTNKQDLAKQYIVNATGAFLSDEMIEALNKKPQNSREALKSYVQALAKMAGVTASQTALVDIYTSRLPNKSVDKDGNQVDTSSLIKTMETEARRRFTNPDWTKAVSVASQEALLREIANIEAARLWVDYQNYRLLENLVAITAVQSANMIKMANKINQIEIPDLSEVNDREAEVVDEFDNIEQ
jgi:hypothetical protein